VLSFHYSSVTLLMSQKAPIDLNDLIVVPFRTLSFFINNIKYKSTQNHFDNATFLSLFYLYNIFTADLTV
jgi:hypothetical protein